MAAHTRGSMGGFAEKHMKRHGWKSGSGLGRNEDGISEAIKVKIKRDSAGVGHDAAEQFTFHWWDHVFNKAASNIQVKNNEDGVELHKKEEGSHIISNEKPVKSYGKKEALYGMFVKSATLTTEGERSVSSSSEDEGELQGIDFSSGLADDELFKACGGRTAHKGARHGLKSNGKLQRLQEQERLLKARRENDAKEEPIDDRDEDIPRKKKKKKKSRKAEDIGYIKDPIDDVQIVKKKRKNKIANGEGIEGSISNMVEENEDIGTGTGKSCNRDHADDISDSVEENREVKKRKKKRKHSKEIINELENVQDLIKKSKKNKDAGEKQSSGRDDGEGILSQDNVIVMKKMKKKKKKNKDLGE